LMHNFWN